MKQLITFIIILGGVLSAVAQNDVQYTHFTFNKLAFNPGYTGSKGAFDVLALYRNQWTGLDGAPETATLTAHAPFADKRNALGFGMTADRIGKVSTSALDLSYSYRLQLSETIDLRLGVAGRIEQARIRWSELELLDTDDLTIPDGDENTFTPNFGGGAFLSSDDFYVGISVPRLLKNSLYVNQRKSADLSRTTYLMGGYDFKLTHSIALLPAIMVSYNPATPLDVDLNATLRFMDTFWVGGSYRLSDSFDFLAGVELKNGLRVGFGKDFTTSDLSKFTNGSYELMLAYTFQCKDCRISNPRFF